MIWESFLSRYKGWRVMLARFTAGANVDALGIIVEEAMIESNVFCKSMTH